MVNVLAIRIDDGDVPFPIVVYGSVIARDDLDRKCIPLFARSRDDPQLIASKDDSLILTGPHRGMVLIDTLYFEINLKLKGDQLMYAFVSNAVEATVSVKVLQGHFYGKITACTSMVKDNILLHDSSLMPGGGVMAADHGNDQFVQLLRPVTAVYLHETLIVTILAQVDGTKYNRRTMYFKPAVNGEGEAQITCGVNSLLVKGHFYGRITACTSTVNDSILLHDSGLVPVGGGVMAADRGNDQFACVRRLRPVMAVCLQETMMVTVLAQVDGTEYNGQTMHFKPVVNGEGEARITCGVNSLLVKVCWSLMD
ncbi:hypothetical protein OsJ_36899 [Oryza sativa Japonica Group]|uniref:DUF6598 domain-containing protein n=1 Tax=Oryza sativa subsp. japonica TaxID=39947 RepID=B9GEB7_ORYSJ|nr:hypothetical protein OsJ_36899 [Oryza sativa Japonica Group]